MTPSVVSVSMNGRATLFFCWSSLVTAIDVIAAKSVKVIFVFNEHCEL
jgi:hypothetical protein